MAVHDVSIVICVKNSAPDLERCLQSLKTVGCKEIIVVDGYSSDGSIQLAEQLAHKVLSDNGAGLAAARRIGVEAATGEYLLILGPDFEISADFINNFVIYAQACPDYAGISAQVRIFNPQTFWDRGLDFWWQFERSAGDKDVIGTPCMFRRDFITEHNFSGGNVAADDTELCLRLGSLGCRLGVVPVIAGDLPGKRWQDVKGKFNAYGWADGQFFRIQGNNWSLMRKIRSLLYAPRRAFKGACSAIRHGNAHGFFFMLAYGWLRFSAMASYLICNRSKVHGGSKSAGCHQ